MVSLSNHNVKATDQTPFDKLRVTRTVVYKQTLNILQIRAEIWDVAIVMITARTIQYCNKLPILPRFCRVLFPLSNLASKYMKLSGLSFPDSIGLLGDSPGARESTLRQAQGDKCHGEPVRPSSFFSPCPRRKGYRIISFPISNSS
jgi:hypothetical protein